MNREINDKLSENKNQSTRNEIENSSAGKFLPILDTTAERKKLFSRQAKSSKRNRLRKVEGDPPDIYILVRKCRNRLSYYFNLKTERITVISLARLCLIVC